MKKIFKTLFKVLIIVVLIVGIGLAIKTGAKKLKAKKLANANAKKPDQFQFIQTKKVVKKNFTVKIPYLGWIECENKATLSAQIPGTIMFLEVDKGDTIKKGQLLVKIDDRTIKTQIQSLKSQINTLKNKINATNSTLVGAKTTYIHLEREYKRDLTLNKKGVIPGTALDGSHDKYINSKSRYESIKKQINSLKSQISSVKANIDGLKVKLSYTEIKAPFDGIVTKKFKEPSDFAGPGMPILNIINLSDLKLVFESVQEDLDEIKVGMTVEILSPNKILKISRIMPNVSKSRTILIECDFKSKNNMFRQGMTVTMNLIKKNYVNATIIPEESLITNNGKVFVYLKYKDKIKKISPKILTIWKSNAVIESNKLKPGMDLIVGEFLQYLRINPDIKIIDINSTYNTLMCKKGE